MGDIAPLIAGFDAKPRQTSAEPPASPAGLDSESFKNLTFPASWRVFPSPLSAGHAFKERKKNNRHPELDPTFVRIKVEGYGLPIAPPPFPPPYFFP